MSFNSKYESKTFVLLLDIVSILLLMSTSIQRIQGFSHTFPLANTFLNKLNPNHARKVDTCASSKRTDHIYRRKCIHVQSHTHGHQRIPLFVVSCSSLSNNNDVHSNTADSSNDDAMTSWLLLQAEVKHDIEKFESYARNIVRTRPQSYTHNQGNMHIRHRKVTTQKDMNLDMDVPPTHPQDRESSNDKSNACMVAMKSFHHSLQQQSLTWQQKFDTKSHTNYPYPYCIYSNSTISNSQIHELQHNLNHAIIQAIRAAADYNDYNLILKIIQSSIDYATQVSTYISVPILQARIFGEAIAELKRTKVSTSKIKKLWKLFISLGRQQQGQHCVSINNTNDTLLTSSTTKTRSNLLVTPPSAFELNAMLMTLSSRGKVKATLSLFYRHVFDLDEYDNNDDYHDGDYNDDDNNYYDTISNDHDHSNNTHIFHIDGDQYTTSTIMNILAESIASDVLLSSTSAKSSKIHSLSSSSSSTFKTKQLGKKYPPSKTKKISSPCWQWQEVEFILDTIESNSNHLATTTSTTTIKSMLNNHVYTTVLKVNEEAAELYKYPGNRHYGSTTAMAILERMKRQNISPDVVTCSAVMSAFDKGMQWKAAVALLKSMQRSSFATKATITTIDRIGNQIQTISDEEKWELPPPNQYSYASAISSCARSGQINEAINILDSLRITTTTTNSNTTSNTISPNTWIYNAALAACLPTKNQAKKYVLQNRMRSKIAMEIFNRMKEDSKSGMDTAPDTVTYNTMIATMGNLVLTDLLDDYDNSETSAFKNDIIYTDDDQEPTVTELETNVLQLLDEMKRNGVCRDPITYRNAILIFHDDAEASMRILDMALDDSHNFSSAVISMWGSLAKIKLYLINVSMSVCASKGDMALIAKLFNYIQKSGVRSDSRSMNHLIIALSTAGYSENSMWILNAMKGDGAANALFQEEYNINIIESGNFAENPIVEEYHYSSAITCCLRQGKLFPALKILNGMKVHGLKPNESNLHGIIVAYCKLATEASSLEFKEAKLKAMNNTNKKSIYKSAILQVEYKTSRDRAVAALAMLKSLKEMPFRLISIVASACAASGMWVESRDLLWSLHISAVKEKYQENRFELVAQSQGSAIAELPKLHTSLLKLCARSGNVTAALWFADAIQDLAVKFERRRVKNTFKAKAILSDFRPFDDTVSDDNFLMKEVATVSEQYDWKTNKMDGIGMTGEEWKLVNIAASKSRHWKVCLGVLQFLKPYIEATHPNNAALGDDEYDVSMMMRLNRDYESLARTLTDSILAFEARSQYAWALRAIDDWVVWSGRRPRKEAIFAVCRILSTRGLGNQVVTLVSKIMSIPPQVYNPDDRIVQTEEEGIPSYETSYERAVYTEAITSLFQNGFYDNADELYATAASQGYLPWAVVDKKSKSTSRVQLDLHGMNKGVAHSAVRVSLQQIMQTIASNGHIEQNVMIVTGKGKRSSKHLQPVLRPEVQRMLMEEFFPPLNSISVPGNLGALSISCDDINSWLKHQQQQRGARFLAMADVLKSLTSGARLRQLLKKKLEEGDDTTSA